MSVCCIPIWCNTYLGVLHLCVGNGQNLKGADKESTNNFIDLPQSFLESSRRCGDVMLLVLLYHDGGDDGDEGVAVGQQAVRRRGAAQGPSYGRRDALREQRCGGGGAGGGCRCRCSAPRLLLLHLLLDMVLYDVAVFHAAGGGAAEGEAARGAVGGPAAGEAARGGVTGRAD